MKIYYCYNAGMEKQEIDGSGLIVVSEKKLPEPKKGPCVASECPRLPLNLKTHTKLFLAIGDPVFPTEELEYIGRNVVLLPKELKARVVEKEETWMTFQYADGSHLWADYDFITEAKHAKK